MSVDTESQKTAPELSNTGANNRKEIENRVSGALDWLSFRMFVSWRDWIMLRASLEAGKRDAIADRKDETRGIAEYGKMFFQVAPSGRGKGFAHLAYVVKFDEELSLAIADSADPQGDCGNVEVTFSGLALLAQGEEELMNRIKGKIRNLCGEIHSIKPSRVDFALDMVGIDMEEVVTAWEAGQVVTRARKFAVHGKHSSEGRKVESLYVGTRSGIMCRIYDKLAETEKDEVKRTLMVQRRWGCVPEKAIRVEFELNREHLKELGVDTYEDLRKKRADIIGYLVGQWLRFTEVKPTEGHQATTPVSSWWSIVQEGFAKWFGQGRGRPTAVPAQRSPKLERQAMGCLASMWARAGYSPSKVSDMRDEMFIWVQEKSHELRDMCDDAYVRIGRGIAKRGWQRRDDGVQIDEFNLEVFGSGLLGK